MDSRSWIEIAGLILTFALAPLAVLFYRWLKGINDSVKILQTNHLPHIELYLRLICDRLGIEYSEPRP